MGITDLTLSERNSFMEIIKRYFNNMEFDSPSIDFWKNAKVPDVEKFLETCKINKKDRHGYTPIMWASRYNEHVEVIKLLIERGADPKIVDNFKWNSVMFACRYNENIEITKLIVEDLSQKRRFYGNRVNKFGCNKLMLAIYKNQPIELIEFLLEKLLSVYPLSVNANNDDSVTPLLLAVSRTQINYGVIKLLLKSGAKIFPELCERKQAILYAIKTQNIDLTQFLFKNSIEEIDSNDFSEIFRQVIVENEIDNQMLDILFENGLDINGSYTITGWKYSDELCYPTENLPILTLVIGKEDKELLNYFLKKRVNVNYKNKKGNSPILYAAQYCDSFEIFKILLDNGADINDKNKANDTTLILAVYDNKNYEIIKYILENSKNDVEFKNRNGMSAMDYFNDHESIECYGGKTKSEWSQLRKLLEEYR